MVQCICYLLLRAVAIVLGLACTAYSAWISWEHFLNPLGPLAAVSAAALFVFGVHAWRDRQWHFVATLGILGVLAAVISGSVVLQRNADTQAARVRTAQSANVPIAEAQNALAKAEQALASAEKEAKAECISGRAPRRCAALEKREAAARKRAADERSKLVALGARTAENPTASVLGGWADHFNRAMTVGPAIWLELAAPVLLAYGFAPLPNREPAPKKKARRRKKKRPPRKPPVPSANVLPFDKKASA